MQKEEELRGLLDIGLWSIVLLIVGLIIQSERLWSEDHVWAVHRWAAVSFGIVPCFFSLGGLFSILRVRKLLNPRSSN
jgi:hypothetical protein